MNSGIKKRTGKVEDAIVEVSAASEVGQLVTVPLVELWPPAVLVRLERLGALTLPAPYLFFHCAGMLVYCWFWFFLIDWAALVIAASQLVEITALSRVLFDFKSPVIFTHDVDKVRAHVAHVYRQDTINGIVVTLINVGLGALQAVSTWTGDQFGLDRWVMLGVSTLGWVVHVATGMSATSPMVVTAIQMYLKSIDELADRLLHVELSVEEVMHEVASISDSLESLHKVNTYATVFVCSNIFLAGVCFFANLFTFGGTSILLWVTFFTRALFAGPTVVAICRSNGKLRTNVNRLATHRIASKWTLQERTNLHHLISSSSLRMKLAGSPLHWNNLVKVASTMVSVLLVLIRLATTEQGQALLSIPKIVS